LDRGAGVGDGVKILEIHGIDGVGSQSWVDWGCKGEVPCYYVEAVRLRFGDAEDGDEGGESVEEGGGFGGSKGGEIELGSGGDCDKEADGAANGSDFYPCWVGELVDYVPLSWFFLGG
jgi:hypothetical protein